MSLVSKLRSRFRARTKQQLKNTRGVRQKDSRITGWLIEEEGQICEGFRITKDDVVADIGCGTGDISCFAARQRATILATDICHESVAQANEKLARSPARSFETHVSDSDPLPLESGVATKVICREVLEHVDDPRRVVSELVRIGQPGATYLITVPDPVGESVQRAVAPPTYWKKPNHLRVFQRDEFDALLNDCGLTIEHRTYDSFYWSMWWILFWGSKQQFGEPEGPLLAHWTATWDELISNPENLHIKKALDEFMPKSQVLVARKAA